MRLCEFVRFLWVGSKTRQLCFWILPRNTRKYWHPSFLVYSFIKIGIGIGIGIGIVIIRYRYRCRFRYRFGKCKLFIGIYERCQNTDEKFLMCFVYFVVLLKWPILEPGSGLGLVPRSAGAPGKPGVANPSERVSCSERVCNPRLTNRNLRLWRSGATR